MFASALFPSRASSSTSHPATHASPRRRHRAPLRRYFYVFDRTLPQLSPHHSPLSSQGCPLDRPGFVLLPTSCLIVSPSASPTLPPTAPHTSPHRRQRFLPLSLTLHSVVAHTTPPVTHLHRRPRFPPVAHASSHRRPRFLPPSPTLPPTVAHASSHRRPRFLPPSPSLPPTVAHASSLPPPSFPPPSSLLPPSLPPASPLPPPCFPPPSSLLPPTLIEVSVMHQRSRVGNKLILYSPPLPASTRLLAGLFGVHSHPEGGGWAQVQLGGSAADFGTSSRSPCPVLSRLPFLFQTYLDCIHISKEKGGRMCMFMLTQAGGP
ncbi:unnamed protein product [Closterium sp. Naga37s-1]|nr:unnamed protein product [Closterium sp. Naga37s-1]CAI5521072.1 unnamed protein product [Closterium sp. Naga37s-1]